jgi:hypothetical protein
VFLNLIPFCHYLPGDSVICHRLRAQSHKAVSTSHADEKSQSLLSTSDSPVVNGGSVTSSLGSTYLIQQLIEFRETLSLQLPFITKDIKKGADEQPDEGEA